jgi:hypothetical protein
MDSMKLPKPPAHRRVNQLNWRSLIFATASLLAIGCSVEPLTEAQARDRAIAAVRDSMMVWRYHYDPLKLPEPQVKGPDENYTYLVCFNDTAQNIVLCIILKGGGIEVSGGKMFTDTMVVSSRRQKGP